MQRIFCRVEKCLGCKTCELACAIEHSESKRLVEAMQESVVPTRRIRVELVDDKGALTRHRTLALQCRYCENPVCVQACISGAIRRDEETGEVRINADTCVGCWSCIMVCPFGGLIRHEGIHRVVKCDHCPDRQTPACVEACPTHALVFTERDGTEPGSFLL